jgi:RNA polymerase sigma factor (sigma-70 family)
MASGYGSSIGARLRTLWTVGTVSETDDQALLSLFADRQDAAADEAFRILVERHGPMVLRVCEQVIGDRQDAEDAAQAVFLVLARKATVLRVQGSLAPWLYGVARRVAAKARGRDAARRRLEQRTTMAAATARDRDRKDFEPESACDWEVVHDEVGRLPAKYRSPVVLCYLQGQTYEEAARRIGCPVGTIRVRLSRARERLRGRLIRRGLAPEGITAVGWFAPDRGAILAPATATTTGSTLGGIAWVETTVRAARAFNMGRSAMAGTVSTSVLSFYEGMVRAMMFDWYRTAAVWLAAASITAAGAIALAAGGPSGQDKSATSKAQPSTAASSKKPAPPPEVDFDSPDTLRKQTERRVAAAAQRLDAQRAYYEEGRITIDRFIDASLEFMLAKMAASTTKEERLAAIKTHWDRMDEVQKKEEAELKVGRGTVADVAEAVVAHENAAFAYIEARQSRGSYEVEDLKKRVDALEKQLQTVVKQLEQRGAAKR